MNDTVTFVKHLPKTVKKAQKGDMEAFRAIFDQMNDRLFGYALSHTGSREDALDIAQETFIELWKVFPQFEYRNEEEFYGFVFLILKRRLYRHYRKSRETVALDENILPPEHILHEENREDYRHLLKHIDVLTQKYRDVIHLHYWCGLKLVEIASLLEVKESTVKIWHYRALIKLRLHLKNYEH